MCELSHNQLWPEDHASPYFRGQKSAATAADRTRSIWRIRNAFALRAEEGPSATYHARPVRFEVASTIRRALVCVSRAAGNARRHCDAPCGASARYCTSIACEAKDWRQQHDSSACSWVNPLLDGEGLYFGHQGDLELAQQMRSTSQSPTGEQSPSEPVSASSSGARWHATSGQPVSGWESESSAGDLGDNEILNILRRSTEWSHLVTSGRCSRMNPNCSMCRIKFFPRELQLVPFPSARRCLPPMKETLLRLIVCVFVSFCRSVIGRKGFATSFTG